jgi:hypothetical protein
MYTYDCSKYTNTYSAAHVYVYTFSERASEKGEAGALHESFSLSLSLSLSLCVARFCLWSATLRGDRLAPSAAALPAHFVAVMVVCKCRKVSKWFRVAPLWSVLYVMVVGAAWAARSDVMGVFMMAVFWFVSCYPCPRSPDPGASSFHSVSEIVIRKWQPLPVVVVVVVVGCPCFLSSPTLCVGLFSMYFLFTFWILSLTVVFKHGFVLPPPLDLGCVRCMAFWVQSLFLRNLGANED